jgi:transcriptional regulator with XRE-family HTH domain
MHPYRGFADVIRKRRKESGLTLLQVATAVGTSVPYISELERGIKQPPSSEVIQKLAAVLGLDGRDLQKEALLSRREVPLNVEGAGVEGRKLAVLLARRFQGGISDEEASAIIQQLGVGDVEIEQ